LKTIEALCVTSEQISRQQIRYDEASGLINAVGDLGIPKERLDFIFDDSCYLFAGMGDVHIHAREDVSGKNCYKEDFITARAALRNGGLCHAGDMPNNPIPPVDDESYGKKLKLIEKAQGELWAYAGIGPETRPLSYKVPYKVYMGPSVGELFFKDLQTLDKTLSFYKGETVSFHCEDPLELEKNKHLDLHHRKRPVSAEVIATKDALSMIEKYGLKGKLCHYSSGEGLEVIRQARARGVSVMLEVTPQHLYFDIEQIKESDLRSFQMNPPIRFSEDRKALFGALKNGEIQFLATDHAPHTQEEKEKGTSGLTGLDTFGPFVTWLLEEGIDPRLIARVASENPGDFFNQFLASWSMISSVYKGFGKGVGYLRPEYRANFTILNLKRPHKVTLENLRTKAQNSPFLGITFPGSVEANFIGGKKV
jgi:dihydroorotase